MVDGVKSCSEVEEDENSEVTSLEERRRSLVTLSRAVSMLCC